MHQVTRMQKMKVVKVKMKVVKVKMNISNSSKTNTLLLRRKH